MIGPTCPACQTIHGSSSVRAVGRFDPAGETVIGYRAWPDGPIRPTREQAMQDVCERRKAER